MITLSQWLSFGMSLVALGIAVYTAYVVAQMLKDDAFRL